MLLCRMGYVGWGFRGTNIQPEGRTVEGEVQKIIGGKVRFLSRTDAGVSAMNNYALCRDVSHPLAVNSLPDVWLTGFAEVKKRPVVFWRWYRYYMPGEYEVPRELLKKFEGEHDFSSFALTEGKDPMREVMSFSSFTVPGFTVFDIVGRSFLRQMVRRLVQGIILHLEGKLDVISLLENPVESAVPPAPPEGLVLMDMGIKPKVPSQEDLRRKAKEKVERFWLDFRIKSFVLSNRWIIR